jgi:glycosyltransferase involved in cell wall biosynthesis
MSEGKRYRILLVIPNLGRGGAQRVFHQQLAFYARYHDVRGCVFNWDGAFEHDKLPGIESLAVPGGKNIISKIFYFFKRVSRLKKVKKSFSADLTISHLEGADYINILSGRPGRIYCWIHGTKTRDRQIHGLVGWLRLRVLMPLLYPKADLLVTVSHGIADELVKAFNFSKDKIVPIQNSFDIRALSALAEHPLDAALEQINFSSDIVVTHCRLARQKNLLALLAIFSKIVKTKPLRLLIIGDGELRDELIGKASQLGLKTFSAWNDKNQIDDSYQVYFLGYFENPFPILKRASLYVLPSSWEGFPLAMCEAMACGVPVIASDCFTGPREILAPGMEDAQPIDYPFYSDQGILMPLADSPAHLDEWSQTVIRLFTEPSMRLRLAEGALHRVKDFDFEVAAKKWLEIIHE